MFRNMYASNSRMIYGCEIEDGWFNILYALCESIQSYLGQIQNSIKHKIIDPKTKVPEFAFLQIKEKLGELRIYFSDGDEYIRGKVSMAAAMSRYVCEYCGVSTLEVAQSKDWIKTLCPRCAKKNKKEIVVNKELSNLKKKVEKYDSKIKSKSRSKKKIKLKF